MRTIGIAAGKGGVGKSTTTVMLAHALASQGVTVGVLDLDMYGPSIRHMLGEGQMPSHVDGIVKPAMNHGIEYFSFAFLQEGAAVVRAPIANRITQQFATEIEWGDLDYLLVDFPPGTGDVPLTAMQTFRFDGMVYVALPRKVALLDIEKAVAMGQSLQVPTIGFVTNMIEGEVPCTPVIGKLPYDPVVAELLDEGLNPLGKCSVAFEEALYEIVRVLDGNTKHLAGK